MISAREVKMSNKFVQYEHHGKRVWTQLELLGKHREHCLCYSCEQFHPGESYHCGTAQALYRFDVDHNVATPVFECALFSEQE